MQNHGVSNMEAERAEWSSWSLCITLFIRRWIRSADIALRISASTLMTRSGLQFPCNFLSGFGIRVINAGLVA